MFNKALGGMAGLGGAALVAALVTALQGGDQAIWLWLIAATGLAFVVVGGGGWLLTHDDSREGRSVEAKADDGSVTQAAGHNATAIQGNQDSNILSNPGIIQVTGDLNIGGTDSEPAKAGEAPTAQLFMVNNFRGIRLDVTNNDTKEDLIVETTVANIRLRPRWTSGDPTRELKRGETGSLMIAYLEPDRADMGLRMPLFAEYELERWKKRVERGTRLIRVYGNDEASDNNSEFLVNQVYTLEVAVLSDSHAPQQLTYEFAVSENCCLIVPYTKEGLDRVNSLGLAKQEFLLAYLERKLTERAAKESGD